MFEKFTARNTNGNEAETQQRARGNAKRINCQMMVKFYGTLFFHASPIPCVLNIFNYVFDQIESSKWHRLACLMAHSLGLLIMTKLINFQHISSVDYDVKICL